MIEPGRQHPAGGVHVDVGRPTFVLLTVCAKDRKRWLACAEAHELLRKIWMAADKWLVGNYVLMPDHLHCLVAPRVLGFPFDPWVTYWKSRFSKSHNHTDWRWQTDEYHHRLRDGENYTEKWWYVRNNPVRRGLVENADDWPYQGMIHELRWA
jgi:putative transposase